MTTLDLAAIEARIALASARGLVIKRTDSKQQLDAVNEVLDHDAADLLARVRELEAAMARVNAQCDQWNSGIGLLDGQPNVVARAFALEVRRALDGAS